MSTIRDAKTDKGRSRKAVKWDPKIITALVTTFGAIAVAVVTSSVGWLQIGGAAAAEAVTQKPSEVALDVATMIESLNRDEFAAAMRLADRILEADPKNFRAYNTKGSVAFYRGEFQEAARYFEKAHALRPDIIGYSMNLADTYVEVGWVRQAIDLYDSVRAASPEWWYAQGRAYVFAGQYQKASELLSLVPTNFNRGTARIVRAAALASLGDEKGARAEWKVGVAQDAEYWRDVLAGTRIEKRESYTKIAQLLEAHHVSKS